jgi:inner membrane protein
MENVCHTLAGAALARAGLDRVSPLAMPTLLVASNLPDADVVVSYWGNLAYLVHHRGITHSWVGIVVLAVVLAGAMYLIGAYLARRQDGVPRPTFWRLFLISAIGLAVHLLLDYTNSYGIRPNQPFDDRWIFGDLVFIVDPWLWLILAGTLFAGSARRVWTNIAFAVLLGLMTIGVVLGLRSEPGRAFGVLSVWSLGILVAVTLRYRIGREQKANLARLAIVLVVSYWGVLAVLHGRAISHVREARLESTDGPSLSVAALPTPFFPDRWRVIAESPESLYEYRVDALGGNVVDAARYDRNLDDPEVDRALGTCAGRVARWFNRFLTASVARGDDGRTTVRLHDIRFGDGGPGSFATTTVTLGPPMDSQEETGPCLGR